MVFASGAARDTALSAVKSEGMHAFLLDTNSLTIYSGSAWSTVGPVHGALTSWTPAIVQSGSVAATVNIGTYQRIGRMVTAHGLVTASATGTGSAVVTISLPVAADAGWVSDYANIGVGSISDASSGTGFYPGHVSLVSSTTCKIRAVAANTNPPTFLGAAGFTAALASGDIIDIQVCYPAAADA